MIEQDQVFADQIQQLQTELARVEKWIADFNTSYAEKIIRDAIATMIFVEISDAGYIMYYIPESWNDITFNTTGLDIAIPGTEDNRLVLSY